MKVIDRPDAKAVRSQFYNSLFMKKTGYFLRWGETKDVSPAMSPSPEILDIEISSGPCSQACKFCYKENGPESTAINMSFDTFKGIFDRINDKGILNQIAFGITDIYANPDFFKMMEYTRSKGVIPNYTTSGFDLDDYAAKRTAELCGAVAVSIHSKEHAFNAIDRFVKAGISQVNVHQVLMQENYEETKLLMKALKEDPRTTGLYALVLLAYKPKGRNAGKFTPVSDPTVYTALRDYAKEIGLNLGFDSCSCPTVYKTAKDEEIARLLTVGEPCESTLFSSYVNVNGDFFPCSFSEGEGLWKEGLPVLDAKDFNEVWFHPKVMRFRDALLNTMEKCNCPFTKECRHCPIFEVSTCHKSHKKEA